MTNDELRKEAWTLHQQGKLRGAEKIYDQLIREGSARGAIDPRDAINLGGLLRNQGRLKEAQKHYETTLALMPRQHQLRVNAINTLIEARSLQKALEINESGLALDPQNLLLIESLGRIYLGLGQYAKAARQFEKILSIKPNDLNGLLGLGQAQDALQKWDLALNTYKDVRKNHPNDSRGIFNSLIILQRLGRFSEASNLYETLPSPTKTSPLIKSAYANFLVEKQDLSRAESIYRELCQLEPNHASHWLNHAAILKSLKHNNSCCRTVKKGLLWEPLNTDLKQALGQCMAEMGKHAAAISCLRESFDDTNLINHGHLNNLQFIGASYGLISSEELKSMAQGWEKQQQINGVGALWGDRVQQPIPNRALRIGYLSADFSSHPVGRFIAPILEHHDRSKVKVICISCGPHSDETTELLRTTCDEWLDIRHATDFDAARLISDQKLDILVELGGFTAHNRLGVLTHRPAPIQLSYLGYCAPTYLKCIDGWIGDKELFKNLNNTDRKAHNLLMVNEGYMAFVPKQLPKLVEPDKNRNFRFGCFNHARKLTTETIILFTSVLHECPAADLVLKSISFIEVEEQTRIRRKFEAAGLKSNRLLIEPWIQGWANHMNRYSQMDIALDTIPYGGATTSCEALLMGVPVLTLAGQGMVGRLTASILKSAALDKWITNDTKSFIQIAKSMITDKPRSLIERKQLRDHVQNSALGNPVRLSEELERIYLNLLNP